MSTASTSNPNNLPWVRNALVAPAFPLPMLRMSTPRSRPKIKLPSSVPSKYAMTILTPSSNIPRL